MNLSEHVVLIGACGWQHNDWTGEFYPDDLPEEWRLGYYGNEYQAVLVPAAYWADGPDSFHQWLEESDDSLKMVCELPPQGATIEQFAQAREGLKILKERVLAVLIPVGTQFVDWQLGIYKELAKDYPLCFDVATEMEPAQREVLSGMLAEKLVGVDYGVCWHASQQDRKVLSLGSVSVTRIHDDVEPRELRVIFETILEERGTDRSMVFLVDGQPPSLQLLTNAGIILDLL